MSEIKDHNELRQASINEEKGGAVAQIITRIVDLFYMPFVRKIVPKQTFRYAVCGGINVLFSWVAYFVTYNYIVEKRFIDLGFVVVSPHIFTLGMVFPFTLLLGYYLNKNIAFKHSPLKGRVQFMRYFLSVMGSLGLNYGLMKLFVEVFHMWATPSQMAITMIIVIYSYLIQRYFTFSGSHEVPSGTPN